MDEAGPYLAPRMSLSSIPAQAVPQALLRPEQPQDGARVDALIEQAFGPGRWAKAAERLRENNRPLLDISVVAWADEAVVGCVRMWPIKVGDAPAVLLGPFAVDDAWRSRGLGSELVLQACAAAQAAGHTIVLLVGDAPFFTKLGFDLVPRGRATLPGPVHAQRVLWRALQPGALDGVQGTVTGAPALP